MSRILTTFALLLIGARLQAQVFILDDFETGDFTATAGQSFTQTLPEDHVLGGERRVRLFGGTLGRASVSDGKLTLVRDDNTSITLDYGSFGDANEAGHLHFDSGPSPESTMDVEVPFVSREPTTIHARLYSFTLENGTPAHHYSTAEFEFRSGQPFRKSIALSDFVGNANLRDLAGFQLQIGSINFLRGTFEISDATLTVIPEPGTTALIVGLSLCSFALVRSGNRIALRNSTS
jgi:hypothetical protein